MTILEFNAAKKLSEKEEKSSSNGETDNLHGVDLDDKGTVDSVNVTPIILVGEMDLGQNSGDNTSSPPSQKANKVDLWATTFNWKAIKRVALTQMTLAMIAMVCILISVMTIGISSYQLSQFIMATYLLVTGHSGLRGSAKSYKHLIFYLIMSALQWMINILVFGCLIFALYDGPYSNYNVRHQMRGIEISDYGTGIALLTAELVGSLCMMGTIITGMLGLTHCCRGFGNVLLNQEKFFEMANRNHIDQV